MQIKQEQSRQGVLICARSWQKFPNVRRGVHCAIRGKSDLGYYRRGEESAAAKDWNDCHLFTVKLIPSAFVFMARRLQWFYVILASSPSFSR